MINKQSTRDGFGQGLLKAGKLNSNIVVLSADLIESTRSNFFKKEFPNRFFQCGVAEQNMMGIASGMALSGKIPFITSFAVFSPGYNWGQIRLTASYQNNNVKIIGSHAGLITGEDGATHQATEDIALMRCLPNLTVIVPSDVYEAEKATLAIAKHKGPVYLRLTRPKTDIITKKQDRFIIGKANILKKGKDITLIGCGPILNNALDAQKKLLKEKISMEIINLHTIKPIDKKTILKSIKKTKKLITLEDHQISGGMGSAILEVLSNEVQVPTIMMGIKDRFGESGTPEQLLKEHKLTCEDIMKSAKSF